MQFRSDKNYWKLQWFDELSITINESELYVNFVWRRQNRMIATLILVLLKYVNKSEVKFVN